MNRTRYILALLLGTALFLASCASGEQASKPSPKPSEDQQVEQSEATRLQEESTEEASPQKKESASAPSSEPKEEAAKLSAFAATTTVTRVVDGDTIDISPAVEGKTRVRLIGVDTPETNDPDCGKQVYADEAKAFTTSRLQRQEVGLEFDIEMTDDSRLLAYVYPDEEEMFNETLLREGYAQVATFPPNVRYVDRFLAAQEGARSAGIGLWGLSPEDLAAQTDRGNGIGGYCLQQEAAQPKVSPQQVQPAPSSPSGHVPPNPDGSCPDNAPIKGNASSGIYHPPNARYYGKTKAEECFASDLEAVAAGYRRAKV